MSRDVAYIDRNTERGEKAVKRRSTGVKFCQTGSAGAGFALRQGRQNPHSKRRKGRDVRMGYPSLFDNSLLQVAAGGCTILLRWNEFW